MGRVRSARVSPFGAQITFRMQPFMFWLWIAAFVPHISEAPTWVSVTSAFIAVWAWLSLLQKVRPLPKAGLAVLTPILAVLVYREFHTLLGPDAATPLLLLLASLKLHEIHRRRDVIIFLFIALLCVMYYLLLSQTILATVYMIAMTLAVAICFIVIHTPPEKLRDVLRSSPRIVGKDVVLALPIFFAFFFLFPRFSTPWGQFAANAQTNIGFSEHLEPGDMAKLAASQDPAFRATFTIQKTPDLSSLYWRGTVLDRTNGWSWLRSHHDDVTPTVHTNLNSSRLEYKVTLEPKYDKLLFALEQTPELHWVHEDSHNPVFHQDDDVFQTMWPNVVRVQYRGLVPLTRTVEPLDEAAIELYTRIPVSLSAKVRELAAQITEGAKTAEEKSDRVMKYFGENGFQYSLTTPQMKTIDKFLFEEKVGFCEHFASAYAILMRAAHVPARVISGFQGGEYNDFSDYLLVRDSNAHAWDEIFTPEKGWVRRDPTTAVSTGRIALSSGTLSGTTSRDFFSRTYYSAQMFWDSMDNRYAQFLMNYDFGEQKNLFGLGGEGGAKRYQFFLALFLAVVVIVFIMQKLTTRSRRKVDPATKLYSDLCNRLARAGVPRSDAEGPLDFANRAMTHSPEKASALAEMFGAIINWRYRGQPPTKESMAEFQRNLKAI